MTKNSGGPLTAAKLTAARRLYLPVLVIDRPAAPAGQAEVSTVEAAAAWVDALTDGPGRVP